MSEEKKNKIISRMRSLVIYFFPLIFFVIALFTLYDYGMNWDSPVHFARGHAFLHYFLTGKKDYSDLPTYCMGNDGFHASVDYQTGEVCDRHREEKRSEMQSTILDFNFFVSRDPYGHPPLSDLFLALSNVVFFMKLGWIEDIVSFHLYPIFATFILALVVAVWTKRVIGIVGSIVAVLVLELFPLLLGEQHFNVKDPIIAAFFLLGIYLFWLSITEKKARYMYLSALAGAVSFGTKINYVFAPVILAPWFLVYLGIPLWNQFKNQKFSVKAAVRKVLDLVPPRILVAMLLYPLIIFVFFFITWPTLWDEPVKNVVTFFTFYKDIGTSSCVDGLLSLGWFKCFNFTTLQYIFITVPIVSLVLFFIGVMYVPKIWKKENYAILLWLSFLILTVLRVTLPGTSIYGGLRHIMEFIGPFSMVAGVGGYVVYRFIAWILTAISKGQKDKQAISLLSLVLVLCLFIPLIITMIKIHPNQNVYYNYFIGGLKGAKEKNVYGYGNTYGNAYDQGLKWMNENAESGAKISLIWGLNQNMTRSRARADITHLGVNRSGYTQLGEYLLTTLEYGNPIYGTFRYNYADRFLRPVYVLEVDSVPLLKIWKNDSDHVKPGLNIKDEVIIPYTPQFSEENPRLLALDLGSTVNLKRIEYDFSSEECKLKSIGIVTYLSPDGKTLRRLGDEINDFTLDEISPYNADFSYLVAGDQAQSIILEFPLNYPCKLSDIGIRVIGFKNLVIQ